MFEALHPLSQFATHGPGPPVQPPELGLRPIFTSVGLANGDGGGVGWMGLYVGRLVGFRVVGGFSGGLKCHGCP